MRAFIACLATETNTFAPFPTGLAAFEENGILRDASRRGASPFAATMGELRRRLEAEGVLGDFCDNPGGGGGGAAGDSTFFLREMVARGEQRAALGCLWDPMVVRMAFEAGVGARLMVRLGGKTSPLSGEPVDLQVSVMATVRGHSEGMFGARQSLGDSVWLQHGGPEGLSLAVTSQRAQVHEPDAFPGLGITLQDKRAIVVKSSSHHEAGFRPLANQLGPVQSPAAMRLDFENMPYTRRDRHCFPRVADPWRGGEPAVHVVRGHRWDLS